MNIISDAVERFFREKYGSPIEKLVRTAMSGGCYSMRESMAQPRSDAANTKRCHTGRL